MTTDDENHEGDTFVGYAKVKIGTRKVPRTHKVQLHIKERRKGLLGLIPIDKIRYREIDIDEIYDEVEEDVYETFCEYQGQGIIGEGDDHDRKNLPDVWSRSIEGI